MLKIRNQKKTINLGIQILRMIFCFNIVVYHCIDIQYHTNIFIYFICRIAVEYYVPTFFLISFYFSYNTFASKNIFKIKERLLRILIPYVIWPFLFWIKYIYVNYKYGIEYTNKYKDLFHQLLIGKPINPVFWFQFCLILWSILFIIIIISFKNLYQYIMLILFITILCFNYSGFIYSITNNYTIYIFWTIYDLFYRNIHMFSGFFFGSIRLLDKKISLKLIYSIFSIIGLIFLIYLDDEKNFGYIRIQFIINIIFIFSSLIPFDLIKNRNITSIINQITSYTGGVYYLHWEIKFRTFNDIYLIKKANFLSCIIIYLICYIFCFLSFRLFKNTKLKFLFI